MPPAGRALGAAYLAALAGIALAAGLLARARRSAAEREALQPLALLALAVGIATATNLVYADTAAVNAAYAGLYAPIVLAALASGAPRWLGSLWPAGAPRERVAGLAISLCATEDGRAQCDAFERRYRLVAVERASLPAIASLPWLPFHGSTVEVVLYRVAR